MGELAVSVFCARENEKVSAVSLIAVCAPSLTACVR